MREEGEEVKRERRTTGSTAQVACTRAGKERMDRVGYADPSHGYRAGGAPERTGGLGARRTAWNALRRTGKAATRVARSTIRPLCAVLLMAMVALCTGPLALLLTGDIGDTKVDRVVSQYMSFQVSPEPGHADQYGPFATSARSAFLSIHRQAIVAPLMTLYLKGPRLSGWGMWAGAEVEDICHGLSPELPSSRWRERSEDCIYLIAKSFEPTFVAIVFAVSIAIMYRVMALVVAMTVRPTANPFYHPAAGGRVDEREERGRGSTRTREGARHPSVMMGDHAAISPLRVRGEDVIKELGAQGAVRCSKLEVLGSDPAAFPISLEEGYRVYASEGRIFVSGKEIMPTISYVISPPVSRPLPCPSNPSSSPSKVD